MTKSYVSSSNDLIEPKVTSSDIVSEMVPQFTNPKQSIESLEIPSLLDRWCVLCGNHGGALSIDLRNRERQSELPCDPSLQRVPAFRHRRSHDEEDDQQAPVNDIEMDAIDDSEKSKRKGKKGKKKKKKRKLKALVLSSPTATARLSTASTSGSNKRRRPKGSKDKKSRCSLAFEETIDDDFTHHRLVVNPGEDLVEVMEKFNRQYKRRNVCIISVGGFASEVEFKHYRYDTSAMFDEDQMQLLSLSVGQGNSDSQNPKENRLTASLLDGNVIGGTFVDPLIAARASPIDIIVGTFKRTTGESSTANQKMDAEKSKRKGKGKKKEKRKSKALLLSSPTATVPLSEVSTSPASTSGSKKRGRPKAFKETIDDDFTHHRLVVNPGEDLVKVMNKYFRQYERRNVYIISVSGSASKVDFEKNDLYPEQYEEQMQLLSLSIGRIFRCNGDSQNSEEIKLAASLSTFTKSRTVIGGTLMVLIAASPIHIIVGTSKRMSVINKIIFPGESSTANHNINLASEDDGTGPEMLIAVMLMAALLEAQMPPS